MSKFIKIILGIVIIVLLVIVGKNVIAKAAIETGVKVVTGVPLSMDHFSFSLTKTNVDIRGLELKQPRGFEGEAMVVMPEIYLDYELGSLFTDVPHIEEIRIDLSRVEVIKNKDGELNLNQLKPMQVDSKEEAQKEELKEVKIDLLKLKVGEVVFKDYSGGGDPSVKTFNIGLDEEIRDIGSINTLVRIIMVKTLYRTTLGKLTDLNLDALQGTVNDALESSRKLATDAAKQATAVAGDAQKAAMQAAEKGSQALKDGTQEAKQLADSAAKKLESSGDAAKEAAEKTKETAQEAADALKDQAKKLSNLKDKLPGFGS